MPSTGCPWKSSRYSSSRSAWLSVLARSIWQPRSRSTWPIPAVMRLMDSELILGTMTPTMRVEPVRSARACAEGAYPVRSIAYRIRSRLSSAR